MFVPFPKLARWQRDIVITEKLDGTNACVVIVDPVALGNLSVSFPNPIAAVGGLAVYAQSRTRMITPGDDNFGFARWVADNAEQLAQLGPGHHFGEWWGKGIQRGYGLSEKRFSLFNTSRWSDPAVRPAVCGVVPVLYQGSNDEYEISGALTDLILDGSKAAPGFDKPEGICIYHTAAGAYFKRTIDNDAVPKSLVKEAA